MRVFNRYRDSIYTYISLTLYRRGSRGISDIPPRWPRSTEIQEEGLYVYNMNNIALLPCKGGAGVY
jgi:hypothetical protein